MKMRKVLATLLAVMLIMTASITAFGATNVDVEEKIKSSVAYALDECYAKDGYNVENSKYFLMYLKAGEEADKYEEEYLSSVKNALDNGTLFGVGSLGTVLSIFDLLGVDAYDFEGYDVARLFEKTDVTENEYSPYNYVYATEAAAAYGLDEYGMALCDQVVSYYEMGVGTDFWGGWGTSADDLSMFIIALAPYADDFSEYIADAFALIEEYNSDEGYTSWGEPNADSTAYALAAYSAVGNKEMADKAYDKLMLFFDEETGGFSGAYDDYYATADAIFGLEYYLAFYVNDPDPEAPAEDPTTEEPTTEEEECKTPAEETTSKEITDQETTQAPSAPEKTPAKSPDAGAMGGTAVALASIALAGAAVMLAKKKESE